MKSYNENWKRPKGGDSSLRKGDKVRELRKLRKQKEAAKSGWRHGFGVDERIDF